jgi:hypothetical protein
MLKIWLTWLQPSVGVLGAALVLSSPLCSIAAPLSTATIRSSKAPAPSPQWSSVKSSGTNIDQALLKGIANTPDQAVRQLAISTMATSGTRSTATTAKAPQNFDPLASFTGTTPKFQQLSAKAPKKPQLLKQAVTNAVVSQTSKPKTGAVLQASKPKTAVIVPGLMIGSEKTPTLQPVAVVKPAPQLLKAAPKVVAAPQLAAMAPVASVAPVATIASPFPVVRPELMQKLETAPVVASKLADIKTASRDLKSIGIVSPGLPKAVQEFSINPIASIPNGLQQLLGNNLDGSVKVAVVPTSKATGPNFRSISALTKLVSPSELVAPASVTTASLRLATAQSFDTKVAKFSIPGEPVVTTATVSAKSPAKTVVSTTAQKNVQPAVTIISGLTPIIRQSLVAFDRTSNLGGLILGSQQSTMPKVVSLLPQTAMSIANFTGGTVSDLGNIN